MQDDSAPWGVRVHEKSAYLTELSDDDTAFGGSRSSRFCVFMVAAGTEADQLVAGRAWVRGFADALSPAAVGGGYVNAMAEYSPEGVRATYGAAKLDRLARIKASYDPGNAFHRNVNIKPA